MHVEKCYINECSFSRLKLVYNHLRMSDKTLVDSLLILFSARDIVGKINIREIMNKRTFLKHRQVKYNIEAKI